MKGQRRYFRMGKLPIQKRENKTMDGVKVAVVGVIAVVAIMIVLARNPVVVIDTGHRGIKVRFGEVIGTPLEEGVHFRTPFVDHIVALDTRTQKETATLTTYTKDVQKVDIEYAVNYNLKRTAAGAVFKETGTN